MAKLHFGIIWDKYTPAVEGQLVKDIIAMTNYRNGLELICCSASRDADRVLDSFGIRRLPMDTLAKLWILYSVTSDIFIEAPECAETIIVRDLEARINNKTTIEQRDNDTGYALPDPGRVVAPRNLQMPSPYSRTTDPAVLWIWT